MYPSSLTFYWTLRKNQNTEKHIIQQKKLSKN